MINFYYPLLSFGSGTGDSGCDFSGTGGEDSAGSLFSLSVFIGSSFAFSSLSESSSADFIFGAITVVSAVCATASGAYGVSSIGGFSVEVDSASGTML